MREALSEAIHGAVLIGVLGGFTLVVGQPLVFPSIGPTAYVMIVAPDDPTHQPKNVIGGHLLGIVAGVLGYHLLAAGVTLELRHSLGSIATLRIVASGAFAMAVTAGGMIWTDIDHAPACATTLIVALGLIGTLQESFVLFGGVVVLVVIEEGVKLAPYTLPRRREE